MSWLQGFIDSPLAGALGWTLLHSLWQGTLVATILALTLVIVRSSRGRYAAACLALFIAVAGVVLTFEREMPGSPGARTSGPLTLTLGKATAPIGISGQPAVFIAIVPWLAPFWIAGVIVFFVRDAAAFAMTRRLRRKGVCAAPERWQLELDRLRERLHLSRPVVLLASCLAEVPVLIGHFRPVILMPLEMLARLPAGQIEAILVHELAHVGRRDYLVNAVQRVVESLLFYHPATWWISRVIRTERENCCDDFVVSFRGEPHEYALALTALEEHRPSRHITAISANGGSLVKRIRRLLYPTQSNNAWTPVLTAVLLIATVAATLGAWQSNQPHLGDNPASPGVASYSNWLNEDVVYIIDDAERAAFQKLTRDDERQKFIEQFWARRNRPGAAENSARDEHYRRIAYANSHYQMASGTPGWRTDRGRMYILYGPPDELESHPPRGATPYKFGVWLYHNVDGIGKNVTLAFFDRTGRGDFQLAPATGR